MKCFVFRVHLIFVNHISKGSHNAANEVRVNTCWPNHKWGKFLMLSCWNISNAELSIIWCVSVGFLPLILVEFSGIQINFLFYWRWSLFICLMFSIKLQLFASPFTLHSLVFHAKFIIIVNGINVSSNSNTILIDITLRMKWCVSNLRQEFKKRGRNGKFFKLNNKHYPTSGCIILWCPTKETLIFQAAMATISQ